MQVHRRLVIYVQGYDPRGLAEYYRMFRREFRRTCELYGLTGKIGARRGRSRALHHRLGRDHQRRRLAGRDALLVPALGRHHPQGFRAAGLVEDRAHVSRHRRRDSRRRRAAPPKAHWRFGLFTLYPIVLMTVWLLLGAFVGTLCMKLVAALGAPALGRPNCRPGHRARQPLPRCSGSPSRRPICSISATTASRPTSSPTASGRTGRSAWKPSPATWSMRCATAMPTRW